MSVHVGTVDYRSLREGLLHASALVLPQAAEAAAALPKHRGQMAANEIMKLAWDGTGARKSTDTVLRAMHLLYAGLAWGGCAEIKWRIKGALLVAYKLEEGHWDTVFGVSKRSMQALLNQEREEILAAERELLLSLNFGVAFPSCHQLAMASLAELGLMQLAPLAEAALLALAHCGRLWQGADGGAAALANAALVMASGVERVPLPAEALYGAQPGPPGRLPSWAVEAAHAVLESHLPRGRLKSDREHGDSVLRLRSWLQGLALAPREAPQEEPRCDWAPARQPMEEETFLATFTHAQPLSTQGAFGVVKRALKQSTPVILKEYQTSPDDSGVTYDALVEMAMLRLLPPHPCIVGLQESLLVGGRVVAVYECMQGDLYEWLNQQPAGGPTPQQVCYIFPQLAAALSLVHSHGRVHADIKPENILTDGRQLPCVKLADFGLAEPMPLDEDRIILGFSTFEYGPPESITLLLTGKRTPVPRDAADIWALGTTVLYLLSRNAPFNPDPLNLKGGTTPAEILELQKKLLEPEGLGHFVSETRRLAWTEMPRAWSALQRMLAWDPAARPNAEELVTSAPFGPLSPEVVLPAPAHPRLQRVTSRAAETLSMSILKLED